MDFLALEPLILELGTLMRSNDWRLSTAESCTGGLIAAQITDVPGSSSWYERGFVAYSNESKHEMLGVEPQTLRTHGSVSEAAVTEMAAGAMRLSGAEVAVGVSGIAGPGGGSEEKPVGMVCIGWLLPGEGSQTATEFFTGDRRTIRSLAVAAALSGLLHRIRA